MHSNLATNFSFEQEEEFNPTLKQPASNVVSNILDILEAQKNNAPLEHDRSEKFLKAREKLMKQLPNMYKNTRLSKFLIQNNPVSTRIEYKKVKGLILNIEKRMSWYLNAPQENIKCLLISIKAKSAKEDLEFEDSKKCFFEYYAKVMLFENGVRKFIPVPLQDLNVIVI